MNYEFYADVFFLTNCYLDFLAVYAAGEVLQQKRRLLRYLICCALSSLAGCVLFLTVPSYPFYLFSIHCIVNPGMVLASFFPAERKIYVKAYFLMYFMVLLLGGSVEWLYGTMLGGRFYELSLLFAAVPVWVFLFILRRKRENVHRFYPVKIRHQGKEAALTALYDTGNTLYDPYVKKPVHIVSDEIFECLGGEEVFYVRLIPFTSVGCRRGMLKAFTVEELTVGEGERAVVMAPAVLATAEEGIFNNRPYQMILHSSVSGELPLQKYAPCNGTDA